MSQQAFIRGEVSFRAGDGMLVPIPPGPVDIDIADDSVTLGWHDSDADGKTANATAITRDEYDRYVREGKIRSSEQ